MPWHMLHHPDDTASAQAVNLRLAKGGDTQRFATQCPVSDNVICARLPHVEQRQAVYGNADLCQRQSQRQRICPRSLNR